MGETHDPQCERDSVSTRGLIVLYVHVCWCGGDAFFYVLHVDE